METNPAMRYPRLLRRVQALLIDGVLVPFAAMGVLVLVTEFGVKGGWAALPPLLTFFILEPFLVSVSGGTIGHHLRGLRVADSRHGKRIDLLRASIRFVLKLLFGIPSLIAFFVTRRYQALHDLASRSVVVLSAPQSLNAYETHAEQRFRRDGFHYPPWYWQVLVVVGYNLLFILLSSVVFEAVTMGFCSWLGDWCLPIDFLLNVGWEVAVLVCLGVTIFYCRRGSLPGCRARPVSNAA